MVVSAMSGVTDQLIGYCRAISPRYDRREHDTVVASGEQVTAGLMALALHQRGLNARSWQGWQVRLLTDSTHAKARILDVEVAALRARIHENEVSVMAGFQGVTEDGRITTLGRGGGDTSAVALAIALKADRCDIYTDVDGVYTTDPRIVKSARKMSRVSYEEMLELASLGAKVLGALGRAGDALSHAASSSIHIRQRSRQRSCRYSGHRRESDMEANPVTGIAYTRDEAKITLVKVSDKPGSAARVFVPLARAGINVDMIVQSASDDGQATHITFTVAKADLDRARKVLEDEKESIGFAALLASSNVTKISLVGIGMRSHAGIAATMFETLAAKGINIHVIETSEISTSVLISDEYTELALRSLHTAYGLDAS